MESLKKETSMLSTNSWMATYTDLMILLLTFFVLLLSLATIDKKRKRLALNSLVGAFGFKPGALSILGKPKGLNITAGSAPLVEEEVQFERLRNVALRHAMESDLSTSVELDRIVITLNNRVLFDLGSTRLKPGTEKFLLELADVFKDGAKLIELRGYADTAETVFEQEPLKYSMLLSSKRAISVFNFLREKGGISDEIMVAHGFGKNPESAKNRGKKKLSEPAGGNNS
jgi:chemotaxis protein MotB